MTSREAKRIAIAYRLSSADHMVNVSGSTATQDTVVVGWVPGICIVLRSLPGASGALLQVEGEHERAAWVSAWGLLAPCELTLARDVLTLMPLKRTTLRAFSRERVMLLRKRVFCPGVQESRSPGLKESARSMSSI